MLCIRPAVWLSLSTVRSAFPLSVNLTFQTLDAMCQNTLQRLSQNHANLPTSYQNKKLLDRTKLRVIEHFA